MLKLPKELEDIPMLPVRVKPAWTGFEARLVGALVWLGLKLRIGFAREFMTRFTTVLGGVVYSPVGSHPGDVSLSLLMHEGLHAWQSGYFWFYRTRYLFSRGQRSHFEAQAYALQVWGFGRSLGNASVSLADPIYGTGLTREQALELISAYLVAWTKKFGHVARSEFKDYPKSPSA